MSCIFSISLWRVYSAGAKKSPDMLVIPQREVLVTHWKRIHTEVCTDTTSSCGWHASLCSSPVWHIHCGFIFCLVLHDHFLDEGLCSIWFLSSPRAKTLKFYQQEQLFLSRLHLWFPLAAAWWGGCGSTCLASLLSGSLSHRSKLSLCYDSGCTVAFAKRPWHATLADASSLPAKETDELSSEQTVAVCVPDASTETAGRTTR